MAKKSFLQLIKQTKILFFLLLVLLLISIFWPKRSLIWEWREKKRIENEVIKWEEVLTKYPGYRDVYLRLAALNWKINNEEKAKEYLEKAKDLDPNSKIIKEFKWAIQE